MSDDQVTFMYTVTLDGERGKVQYFLEGLASMCTGGQAKTRIWLWRRRGLPESYETREPRVFSDFENYALAYARNTHSVSS